jgi:hypothetical protein
VLVALVLGMALQDRWSGSPRSPSATSQTTSAPHENAPAPPELRPLVEVLPPGDTTPSAHAGAVAADEPPGRKGARAGSLTGKPRWSSATRPPKARGKTPTARNCNPPTYLDADGVRIYKDECL